MNILFDASAFLNIIRKEREKAYNILVNSYVLTLTPYEIGNAIWKEAKLQKRISLKEALELLNAIFKVMRKIKIIEVKYKNKVFKIAYTLRVTYYDASYIVAAAENNLILVTDDEKLLNKLKESEKILVKNFKIKIETLTSTKLLQELKMSTA